MDIDARLIRNMHHSSSELQGRDGLLEVLWLGPDVSHHERLAVTPYAIFQKMSEFALAVRDMVSFAIAEGDHHLF